MPDWSGKPCVIVASGQSAGDAHIGLAKGKAHVLTINESWRLAPWADALYACDGSFWRRRRQALDFCGLRITQDAGVAARFGLHRVELARKQDRILTETKGLLGWGGHGGFHALNLAVQAGSKQIVLVGYDLTGSHWHGRHEFGLQNPREAMLRAWAKTLDEQAGDLVSLGVEVLNASPISALEAYRNVSLEDVFG